MQGLWEVYFLPFPPLFQAAQVTTCSNEPGQGEGKKKKRKKQKPSFPQELTEEAVCSVMSEMSGEIKHNTRVSPTRDDTSFD